MLVGPPGAGKTTVGALVAARLGVRFLDTDAAVEAEAGQPIADIFVDHGEPHFRALEAAAVARALAGEDGVVALGGGAVLDPETRRLLTGHRVVFLDVGIADAASRVGLNRDRPLLLGNPRGELRRLMAERRPVYEEVAERTVATDRRPADEVAEEVVAVLRQEVP